MTYSLQDLQAMIPIYLNGSLPESEARAFEEGLKHHPVLQKELKAFSEIQESYAEIEDNMPLDSGALFARIRHGIRSESQQVVKGRRDGIISLLSRLAKNAYHTPALSWSIAGLQFAALLALFFIMPQQLLFKTYTSTSPPAKDRVRINVVFFQGAKEIEIRTLLQELGAVIIDGPNTEGLYVLQIQATRDIDQLLQKLNRSPVVRLAEKSLSQLGRHGPFLQAFHDRLNKISIWPAFSAIESGGRALQSPPCIDEPEYGC